MLKELNQEILRQLFSSKQMVEQIGPLNFLRIANVLRICESIVSDIPFLYLSMKPEEKEVYYLLFILTQVFNDGTVAWLATYPHLSTWFTNAKASHCIEYIDIPMT